MQHGNGGAGGLPGLPIAAVERETGLTKDTLRVWERRYGFPRPGRDSAGDRVYPAEQVDTLRLLRRLLDRGFRPRRIVGRTMDELRGLEGQADAPPRRRTGRAVAAPAAGEARVEPVRADLQELLETLRSHRVDDLRRALSQTALRIGLARFVEEVVAPMNQVIGDAWARGEVQVFEEHLYSESIAVVIRNAIHAVPRGAAERASRPRILLTTLPQEAHGLGLLMAEAVLSLSNCHCISLGTQTPMGDIARAAAAHGSDVVALSFSAGMRAAPVLEGLTALRALLPSAVALWAGGSCPALRRRVPPGVDVVESLGDIPAHLAAWHAAHVG